MANPDEIENFFGVLAQYATDRSRAFNLEAGEVMQSATDLLVPGQETALKNKIDMAKGLMGRSGRLPSILEVLDPLRKSIEEAFISAGYPLPSREDLSGVVPVNRRADPIRVSNEARTNEVQSGSTIYYRIGYGWNEDNTMQVRLLDRLDRPSARTFSFPPVQQAIAEAMGDKENFDIPNLGDLLVSDMEIFPYMKGALQRAIQSREYSNRHARVDQIIEIPFSEIATERMIGPARLRELLDFLDNSGFKPKSGTAGELPYHAVIHPSAQVIAPGL